MVLAPGLVFGFSQSLRVSQTEGSGERANLENARAAIAARTSQRAKRAGEEIHFLAGSLARSPCAFPKL